MIKRYRTDTTQKTGMYVYHQNLSYNHTERQAERQASTATARSHWNALRRLKIGPRPIPKCHHRLNVFNLPLTLDAPLDAWCGYALKMKTFRF